MRNVSRRIFVLGGLAAASTAASSGLAAAASPYPFRLGIASGEPAADGVVLWTRLAPSPLNTDGQGGMANADVTVEWQVSTTDRFTSLAASGTVVARFAAAHSVHVEVAGLAPDADYYYRFRAQGHISPVGRTRTAPALTLFGRDLTIAFASCAHYETGYYTAYRRLAEDRPGLVLHLGDYIYEGGAATGQVRQHIGTEIVSLANYRLRYALYKSDPDLQAAHAAAPWLVVPDDHEVENNYANMVRANNDPPLTAAQFAARRAAAYQAYYENMPLRSSSAPTGSSIGLYRRVRWGKLATFHMLDTRQFRDDQACGDGWKNCADAAIPTRTLTGAAQETWLLDGLAQHYGTWDILGQQVFFARQMDAAGAASMDAWDGYLGSRTRLQEGWVQRGVRNPVVLTGDVHKHWANDLKANYAVPTSATIGTELVTSSISSGGNGSGSTTIPNKGTNPHLRFHADRRGYVLAQISQTNMLVNFRGINSITEHGDTAYTMKSFVIQEGRPGLVEV